MRSAQPAIVNSRRRLADQDRDGVFELLPRTSVSVDCACVCSSCVCACATSTCDATPWL